MKKALTCALAMLLALTLLLAGCSAPASVEEEPAATEAVEQATEAPAPEAEKLYTAGTYTAVGTGRNGDVEVTAVFSEEAMISAEVTQHGETAGISDAPIARIPVEVVEYQSLAVDTVAGATMTSNAILAALADIIDQAGGDVESWRNALIETTAKEAEEVDLSVDIVIVGGGGAGMAAAVSAAENGASVLVLEKTAALGGNTVRSGGAYNAVDPERQHLTTMTDAQKATVESYINAEPYDEIEADLQKAVRADYDEYLASGETGLFDSVSFHMLQTYKGGDYRGNIELIRILCEQSPVTLKWLEDNGFTWKPDTFTIAGATWQRSHQSDKTLTGVGFIDALNAAGEQYDIEYLYETPAKELIQENGIVTGVKAEAANGTYYTIHASKGVILTCGGFGANKEMVRKYRPDISENAPTSNSPAITGDGILMAQAVGAQLIDMELIQLYPIASAINGDGAYGMVGPTTAMCVNPKGERYVNEYERRDVLAQAAFDQGGVIYTISDSIGCSMRDPDGVQQAIEAGAAYKADTLEELAEQLGMDPEVLIDSVNKFNSYADAGYDPDFGRSSFDSNVKVVEPPFYASPRSPSIHHTMGGVKIDTECHVLNEAGEIISGLYAAGEVTGGIHGNNRLGGNAVPDALTYGRIAGAIASK